MKKQISATRIAGGLLFRTLSRAQLTKVITKQSRPCWTSLSGSTYLSKTFKEIPNK